MATGQYDQSEELLYVGDHGVYKPSIPVENLTNVTIQWAANSSNVTTSSLHTEAKMKKHEVAWSEKLGTRIARSHNQVA